MVHKIFKTNLFFIFEKYPTTQNIENFNYPTLILTDCNCMNLTLKRQNELVIILVITFKEVKHILKTKLLVLLQ